MSVMTREISNYDDIIDSRDVIARIEELAELIESGASGESGVDAHELATLRALADEASQYADDWQYGEALIRDSYFTEYAEQLAEGIGAIDRDAAWPVRHIDWEAAADELKTDYTSVEFDGVTYWIR